jgi:C1A family cysteine protease
MRSVANPVDRPNAKSPFKTGWRPPFPDMRDYTPDHPGVAALSKQLGFGANVKKDLKSLGDAPGPGENLSYSWLPTKMDLSQHCSPIENQGALGSCTAQAAVGIVEYFERRAFQQYINGSRLFVYKTTRNLDGVTGDVGSWNRSAMAALALCGCAPEKYWPYTDAVPDFDEEPPAFVYALADNYEALKYFCHDPLSANRPTTKVLLLVKLYIAAGIPSTFGFWGFEEGHWDGGTYVMPYEDGKVYYPAPGDWARWGHAVVAVGYDDKKKIKNPDTGQITTGALMLRNSWGTGWGDNGYGWIPYAYVLDKIALDFWSLLNMKWVATKQFGL